MNMGTVVTRQCPMMASRSEIGNVLTPSEHGLFYGGGYEARGSVASRRREDTHCQGHESRELRGRRRAAPGQNSRSPGPSTSAPKKTDKGKEKSEPPKVYIKVRFGTLDLDGYYFSPYPEMQGGKCSKLFICEYCFKCMRTTKIMDHLHNCSARHNPPGWEIYRKNTVAIREVDGEENPYYCHNLCLLCKLFLENKLINPEVKLFHFYILTQTDKTGPHMVGYFSKTKELADGCSLSCILILPPYRKMGYGKLLIDFSYTLSKVQGFVGTPERPLSDLGEMAFRSYWSWVLLEQLQKMHGKQTSVAELTRLTAIQHQDIITTLKDLRLVRKRKGRNVVQVDPRMVEQRLAVCGVKRPMLSVDPECLKREPTSKKAKVGTEASSQRPCTSQACTKSTDMQREP